MERKNDRSPCGGRSGPYSLFLGILWIPGFQRNIFKRHPILSVNMRTGTQTLSQVYGPQGYTLTKAAKLNVKMYQALLH